MREDGRSQREALSSLSRSRRAHVSRQNHQRYLYVGLSLSEPPSGGTSSFATWFYWIDKLAINVMFAEDGEKRNGLIGAWHPRHGTCKLLLGDFDFSKPSQGSSDPA